MRLLHGTLVIFCPLADLAISVFREVSIHTVFTQIRTSRRRGLRKMIHEKNWRVSLCVQELYHSRDCSEFLQPFRYVGIIQVAPFLIVVFVFIWFGIFGWFSQQLLFRYFRRARVSPLLPFNMFP